MLQAYCTVMTQFLGHQASVPLVYLFLLHAGFNFYYCRFCVVVFQVLLCFPISVSPYRFTLPLPHVTAPSVPCMAPVILRFPYKEPRTKDQRKAFLFMFLLGYYLHIYVSLCPEIIYVNKSLQFFTLTSYGISFFPPHNAQ